MSEEVKDAGRYVPVAIAWGYFGNGILALIVIIGFVLALPSVPDALADKSGFPFLYVFQQIVSLAGVNGLTAIILIPVIFSNILFNASTARQTHAFARDKGLPFSRWISTVELRRRIPVRAIALSCIISGLLSLINIGSPVAFNAIISLNVAALMYTYMVSISCVIYRKIYCPDSLPPRRWSLGRFGLLVNIIGLLYVLFSLFWSFWPPSPSAAAGDFNWSVVIFVAVFALSLIMYMFQGRYHYVGPVVTVQRRD
jgi:amino acid transporter